MLASRTVVMHNFVDPVEEKTVQKKDYVLYFGRYSQEKGITTLVEVAKELPEIPFVFAGGVMSNTYIRNHITEKYGAFFASPELSSDNAVGIAVMSSILAEK